MPRDMVASHQTSSGAGDDAQELEGFLAQLRADPDREPVASELGGTK
jgi:hypothetical protein